MHNRSWLQVGTLSEYAADRVCMALSFMAFMHLHRGLCKLLHNMSVSSQRPARLLACRWYLERVQQAVYKARAECKQDQVSPCCVL